MEYIFWFFKENGQFRSKVKMLENLLQEYEDELRGSSKNTGDPEKERVLTEQIQTLREQVVGIVVFCHTEVF